MAEASANSTRIELVDVLNYTLLAFGFCERGILLKTKAARIEEDCFAMQIIPATERYE